jgi:hypothetical protein
MAGLEQLAAQAMSNTDGEEDLEKQIQEAIACPCVGKCPHFHTTPPIRSLRHRHRHFLFETIILTSRFLLLYFPFNIAADLRDGPCGTTFVGAFSCYIRSSHEEKGMDCLEEFKSFQECLHKNPDHVEKIMDDAHEIASNGAEEEEEKQ